MPRPPITSMSAYHQEEASNAALGKAIKEKAKVDGAFQQGLSTTSPQDRYLLQRLAEENAILKEKQNSLAAMLYEAQSPYPEAPTHQQYASQVENYDSITPEEYQMLMNIPSERDIGPGLATSLMKKGF